MPAIDFLDWMAELTRNNATWYVKRLSANDTHKSQAHQAGTYVPKEVLFRLFPSLNNPNDENPRVQFPLYVGSSPDCRQVTAIWYNNSLRGKTRNECRLTGFGGQKSDLLDPDSTGALTIFAFVRDSTGNVQEAHVWVCRDEIEEEQAESLIGVVHPRCYRLVDHSSNPILPELGIELGIRTDCRLSSGEIPSEWLSSFPKVEDTLRKAVELCPEVSRYDVDRRLLSRRECEYEIFQSIEKASEIPVIKAGFSTIGDFIARAQSILQRRKSRSGRSLELQVREIFIEEGLKEGDDFEHGVESDPGRRPDFLFPSQQHYRNPDFPKDRLRMLAVKTTCRDRWRQILNEADRISTKHLLTLQPGVSGRQFQEMRDSGVRLVVPKGLEQDYPKEVQSDLITLESFIGDVRLLDK